MVRCYSYSHSNLIIPTSILYRGVELVFCKKKKKTKSQKPCKPLEAGPVITPHNINILDVLNILPR